MSRTVTTALQTELSKTITRLGYLVQFSMSPTIRWCNIGDVTWNSVVYADYDFEISGISGSADGPAEATMTVQNLDNAIAAAFMTADAAAVICDVWQVAPAAVALTDVVRLGKFLLGDCDIGLDKMTLKLIPENSLYAFSPRRRVDPSNGFNIALPEGTKIVWGSEIFVVESYRG